MRKNLFPLIAVVCSALVLGGCGAFERVRAVGDNDYVVTVIGHYDTDSGTTAASAEAFKYCNAKGQGFDVTSERRNWGGPYGPELRMGFSCFNKAERAAELKMREAAARKEAERQRTMQVEQNKRAEAERQKRETLSASEQKMLSDFVGGMLKGAECEKFLNIRNSCAAGNYDTCMSIRFGENYRAQQKYCIGR